MIKRIRVLIVDDSALVRRCVADALGRASDIEVVGTAPDAYVAREKILALKPDVLTLDIEMPHLDGLSFLKLLMVHRPMPVIVMSSLTKLGSAKMLEAFELGAVDVIAKPGSSWSLDKDPTRLVEAIRAAGAARLKILQPDASVRRNYARLTEANAPATRTAQRRLVLLGASTGGTQALRQVLASMRGDLPGICIVQHIPSNFSRAFAEHLDDLCAMHVREAKHGDTLESGLALVAPGGYHLALRWTDSRYEVLLNQGPPLHHQRPSVDILFESAVRAGAGPHAIAALLTGMGKDGAHGLLQLREAGARTIAQNEESCVVFGMPREAIQLGAAEEVLPLEDVGPRIQRLLSVCH